jgi:hypothetical protein
MKLPSSAYWAWSTLLFGLLTTVVKAQGPAPETAPPLFPGGALLSYSSAFTTSSPVEGTPGQIPASARPTFSYRGDFTFTWGFYPNFDFTLGVPVVTNHFRMAGNTQTFGGTNLGDTVLLVKYRFFRRDSPRGTTQASVTFGPKLPTGRTNLTNAVGEKLPAGLQLGSGSTDFFLSANWTHTGLFNIRRLVADEDFHILFRTQGVQSTKLGSDIESRFWLSYRPYESKHVGREWFVGPVVTWKHSQDDRIANAAIDGSGGDSLLAGVTTYVGIHPGTHVWFGVDWNVAHSQTPAYTPIERHISFGITKQFRLHL